MYFSFLDFVFPRMCYICKRHGNYICHECKKLLKRNLPECYVCRRLSPSYVTHIQCKKSYSLQHVFVAWEYNRMSSDILKQYKYKNVKDISGILGEIFIRGILDSSFSCHLKDSLLVPVPISNARKRERGFNQMESISTDIGKFFNLEICNDLVFCKNSGEHKAGKSKSQRIGNQFNPFYISYPRRDYIKKFKSITLVDDVITTGGTLEMISKVIKDTYGMDMQVNALCMFRGKPYYLPN